MVSAVVDKFAGHGGTQLALHRLGEGPPLVLLHGLFSDAHTNWLKFGTAQRVADAGYEVLMPDLRAHGQSEAPHDAAAYPDDVLVADLAALVAHLKLDSFDLGGFSLGARTVVRAVLEGLAPQRLIIAGMGLSGLSGWDNRAAFFIDAIDRFDMIKQGDPAYFARSFMKTQKVDRVANRMLLQTMRDTDPDDLARVAMPTAVVCGTEDQDNGSAQELADALPDAQHIAVPGTHMSSVAKPDFGRAIADWLVSTCS